MHIEKNNYQLEYQNVDNRDNLQKYLIEREIGRGASGVCYRVKNIINGNIYVMKKIMVNFNHSGFKSNHHRNKMKAAWMEVQILSKLKHHNIIKYQDAFNDDMYLYIIMEYAHKGDLHSILKRKKAKGQSYQQSQVWQMMQQIISALYYLHESGIVHRDVKTLNVLVSSNDTLKLGDLGVSKLIQTHMDYGLYSRVGTPLYLAPQIIKYQKYDYKADIWGCGCIAYILATLEHPFQGKNIISLGQNIVNQQPKPVNSYLAAKNYSQRFVSFTMDMLEKNPKKRLSAKQLTNKYFLEKPSPILKSNNNQIQQSIQEIVIENNRKQTKINQNEFKKIQNLQLYKSKQQLFTKDNNNIIEMKQKKRADQFHAKSVQKLSKNISINYNKQMIAQQKNGIKLKKSPIVLEDNYFSLLKPQKQFVSKNTLQNKLQPAFTCIKVLQKKTQNQLTKQDHTVTLKGNKQETTNNQQITKINRIRCTTAKVNKNHKNSLDQESPHKIFRFSTSEKQQEKLIHKNQIIQIGKNCQFEKAFQNKTNEKQIQSNIKKRVVRPQSSISKVGMKQLIMKQIKRKKYNQHDYSLNIQTQVLLSPEVIIL